MSESTSFSSDEDDIDLFENKEKSKKIEKFLNHEKDIKIEGILTCNGIFI
jgi:hypothetical protein